MTSSVQFTGAHSFTPDDRFEVVSVAVDAAGTVETWRVDVIGFGLLVSPVDPAACECGEPPFDGEVVAFVLSGWGDVRPVQYADCVGKHYEVVRRGEEPTSNLLVEARTAMGDAQPPQKDLS